MEKPRTIIKKYTIPILFNYQDSKLWIITGCGKVSKIAIPKMSAIQIKNVAYY
jgi:hypothetical protein